MTCAIPPPITPAPTTPTRIMTRVLAGQIDARQPEAGGFELVRCGKHRFALPQPVQPFDAYPFDDSFAERLPALVVRALEFQAEQTLDEPLGFAALDAVAQHRLVDALERGDQTPTHAFRDVVGVALDDRREALQLLARRRLTG